MIKSKYAGQCKKCQKTWNVNDEVFISKSQDGNSWITCVDKECFISQGGKAEEKQRFQTNKFPITDAIKLYNLSEEILTSFLSKRSANPLSVEQQAVFIESIFRTLTGSFKP